MQATGSAPAWNTARLNHGVKKHGQPKRNMDSLQEGTPMCMKLEHP